MGEGGYCWIMVRHLITSACFVIPAAALVGYIAWRYDHLATARTFFIAAPMLLVLVGILSAGSATYTQPCPDNKLELCSYNDSVPAIAVAVFVFVIASGIRAWFLYAER